jgi:hypothetical protein
MEFQSLGPHDKDRRRIIAVRSDHRGAQMKYQEKNTILKIPFLLFSDETVEDRDDILLPIVYEIMAGAAEQGTAR